MPAAFDPVEIPLGASEEETKTLITALCTRVLPGWAEVNLEELTLTPITGGISNLLVKVTPTQHAGLQPVAVKVFGNKTELLIDRQKELQQLHKLNSCGFGAEVVGEFANGRIEAFLTAKTLKPEEMSHPKFVPRIAALLRKLHSVPTDGKPVLWPTIMEWFEMAKALEFEDLSKQAKFAGIDFASQEREILELKAICDRVPTEVVFSHNDLLSGNILIVREPDTPEENSEGTMQFIDYEYSDCGYRGFDLGNHFNEYAGFECDYSRYPDTAAQWTFFRHYLSADKPPEVSAPTEDELSRLEAETNVFALASHVYWGVWSLIQARYSPIDFDYLEYSGTRWAEYFRRKPEFVAKAKHVFGIE
uniref:ethanolamine kinase n=1 Tax=Chlamydomonas euryale TaxID=1486919 RepID=A0A7R9YXN4_9CHLO|mmetsp:Transcript_31992/g.95563  ORF Transcript_31992/g.95563 Transcript_31992/m.95563 type:complete len:362 (+) Transcript_31992:120-1205(+)